MYILAEIILITTGIINIITTSVFLLGILISGRRTPTHLYLIYTVAIWLVKQLVNPVFHEWFISDIIADYDVKDILTLVFMWLIVAMMIVMYLLLLMDYFKWISNYKYIVILSHFLVMLLIILIYHFISRMYEMTSLRIIAVYFILLLIFLLLLLTHNDIDILKRRKTTDSESELRNALIITYISVRILTVLIFLLEWPLSMIIHTNFPGYVAIGFYHLDVVFYFVVLIKKDVVFKNRLLDLFRMCTFSFTRKVQFVNLPNDGSLLNQESAYSI